MDEPLCGTFLTGSKILSLLSTSPQANIDGLEIQSMEATVIGEDQGSTSTVMRVRSEWSTKTTSTPQPPKSIIIKVIGNNAIFDSMRAEEVEKLNTQMRQIHNVECNVYELEELPKLMNFPICYFKTRNTAEEPGIIGLEDLADRAVCIPGSQFGVGINRAQLDQILDAMTTLHSWSVNTSVDWQRTIPLWGDLDLVPTFYNRLAALYQKSKETYPDTYKNIKDEKLIPFLNFESFLKVFGCDPQATYGLPRVLVHGDLDFLNTLWEKRDDGTARDNLVAIIDWQLSHQGCGVEDLARVMVLSLSIETRRKYKDYMLEQYVEVCFLLWYSVGHKRAHYAFSFSTRKSTGKTIK